MDDFIEERLYFDYLDSLFESNNVELSLFPYFLMRQFQVSSTQAWEIMKIWYEE